jgi:hypothetical protein
LQLSSLYEIKPPISKAKMTAITKGAIRAIKYYKHVVQSVEKFIQKCRPEYKIPGDRLQLVNFLNLCVADRKGQLQHLPLKTTRVTRLGEFSPNR